ncbi:hypothetical protein F5Y10DRAFT_233084 [Nemania abortiva]|nr:hypothetical protein F5Y10DRAFT_233084 [Nemania abortiva]
MPSANNKDTKKTRRVSFAVPNSPNTAKPKTRTHSRPASPSPLPNPQPTPQPNPQVNSTRTPSADSNTGPTPQADSTPAPSSISSPPEAATPAVDKLAGLFTHTVTNTPHGLVVDGVLQPRGATAHSRLPNTRHQPNSFPGYPYNPSIPQHLQNPAPPQQANMSSVAAGLMPDPNAVHYQPPVPDTTHGPFEYTYVPRNDPAGPQYMMANGVPAGSPPFYAPGTFPYQQPQPGMATAPIPMMGAGQPPFMPGHPMQPPMVNYQPGAMPPMAYVPGPGGPAYVAPGIGQPTPPVTPPGTYFFGGGNGGVEMGKTTDEINAENQSNALNNQMNEPQGIKPADDNISRMYWCRELDGKWTSRSRFSLDRMGNFRWYVTENGVFYAKMLVE